MQRSSHRSRVIVSAVAAVLALLAAATSDHAFAIASRSTAQPAASSAKGEDWEFETGEPLGAPAPSAGFYSGSLGTWRPLPADGLPVSAGIRDIAIASPETAFIIVDGDIYRSVDAGATWSESFNTRSRWMQGLAVSPAYAADHTLFAVDGAGRVFRSADGGLAWREISRVASIGGASDASVWLAISPASSIDPILWACSGGRVYHSVDRGLTWEPFDPGLDMDDDGCVAPDAQGLALEAMPSPAIRVKNVPSGLPDVPVVMAASGATMMLAARAGLFRSLDGGTTWREAGDGLPRASIVVAAAAPEGTLYAAVAGARLYRLTSGAARWEPLNLPRDADGEPLSVNALVAVKGVPPVLFVTGSDELFVTRDDGRSWAPILHPARQGKAGASELFPSVNYAITGIALLVTGRRGDIYQTRDGGATWSKTSLTPIPNHLAETPDGRWIAFAPGAIHKWAPLRGAAWSTHPADVSKPVEVYFWTEQHAIAVDANRILMTRDGGKTWTRAGSSATAWQQYAVSPHFGADHAIYAHDCIAPYVSRNLGATWLKADAGLPVCEVDGPACGLERLWVAHQGDGYNVYALVRHDYRTQIWTVRAGTSG